MKLNKIGCLLLVSINATTLCAGTMGPVASSKLMPHLSVQFGGFWATQGREQHINIVDLIGDDFTVTRKTDANGLVGLGLYWNGLETQYVNLSYGIDAFYLPSTVVKGEVVQENLFTNLAYRYSLTNWPLYFGAKADVHPESLKRASVTVDVGIGPNFIHTHHFGETSLDGGVTLPDRIFNSHTSTAFSAMAGIGLKFNNVFGSAPLECGYRFFYLGQGNFNRANTQVIDKLKTGDSYANALVCSVTV